MLTDMYQIQQLQWDAYIPQHTILNHGEDQQMLNQ